LGEVQALLALVGARHPSAFLVVLAPRARDARGRRWYYTHPVDRSMRVGEAKPDGIERERIDAPRRRLWAVCASAFAGGLTGVLVLGGVLLAGGGRAAATPTRASPYANLAIFARALA